MLRCITKASSLPHSLPFALTKRSIDSTHVTLSRSQILKFSTYHKDAPTANMTESRRTYADVLTLLGSLQSNEMIATSIGNSRRNMNLDAIPEMIMWLGKAGYKVEDFNELRVIHVAGTKGKGSVSAFTASILQQYSSSPSMLEGTVNKMTAVDDKKEDLTSKMGALGKIGLYTSPHLITVRERIRINNEPLSQALFTRHFFTLWDRFSASAAEEGHHDPSNPETKPGYFRFLTIMALHVFLQEGVRSAVIECGIGGEYDSTNIFTRDAVTVTTITKLGIDHIGMLGDNISKIAWHKGGIMKEGVQCFTVSQEPDAMQVLMQRATEKRAELITVTQRVDIGSGYVKIGLEGDFQKDNASLAVAVAAAHLNKIGFDDTLRSSRLPEGFSRGLQQVKWEGRCEVRTENNIDWCIDGAHTMESLNATAEWFAGKLQKSGKKQAMLIFNQQNRDGAVLVLALHLALERATGMRHIFSNAAFCTNAPYKATYSNEAPIAADVEVQKRIADAWSEFEPDTETEVYSSIEEAIEYAREISKESERLLVLVTGSLHLVGGFLQVLQGPEAEL